MNCFHPVSKDATNAIGVDGQLSGVAATKLGYDNMESMVEVAVFDYSEVLAAIWDGRWQGIEILAAAIWTSILTHWWVGPLLIVIGLTATKKAWKELLRYVGSTYIHSHTGG